MVASDAIARALGCVPGGWGEGPGWVFEKVDDPDMSSLRMLICRAAEGVGAAAAGGVGRAGVRGMTRDGGGSVVDGDVRGGGSSSGRVSELVEVGDTPSRAPPEAPFGFASREDFREDSATAFLASTSPARAAAGDGRLCATPREPCASVAPSGS